jgi:phage/plasmid-like protein (TIGR03299 family)
MSSGMLAEDHMMSGNNITPWHRNGTVIAGLATAQEAVTKAKLNYEVLTEPIQTTKSKTIAGYKRVFRGDTDRTFGIVGEDFTPIQNLRLAELVEPIVQHADRLATFETAGSIYNGEFVYFLLNLRDFKLANGENHKSYLAMMMGHGGKKAITAILTNVRIVCKNTINQALGEGDKLFKVKHTLRAEERLIDELRVLAIANKRSEEYAVAANKMLNIAMSMDEANKLLKSLMPSDSTAASNNRDEVIALFRKGKGNEGKTLWDWVNGVTEYADHHGRIRVTEGRDEGDVRVYNSLLGTGAKLKDRAWELALNLAD